MVEKGSISLRLLQAANTHIIRFVKTKAEATPFDPKWDSYFEERDTMRMLREIKGKRRLNYLYKRQNGRCPCCGQRLTVEAGFQIHLFTDLEPYEGKRSCTVLRGERGSNTPDLPDLYAVVV